MDNFRDSYFQVDWDLTSKRLKGTYWGKQYDTGRGFSVTVINGGQVVAPTNEVLRLKWEKPDNTTGYVNATIVNGKFIVENIDQMFTVHGSVRADFELSVGGKFVASITFYVNVEKAVAVDAIESSSDFTALQVAIAAVDNIDAQLAQKANDTEVRKKSVKLTLDDLSQSVKESMTGGSVAVVGEGAVTTPTLGDKVVTPRKLSGSRTVSDNLINKDDLTYGGYITANGGTVVNQPASSGLDCYTPFIEILPNTSYYKNNESQVCIYNENKEFFDNSAVGQNSFSTSSRARYIRASFKSIESDYFVSTQNKYSKYQFTIENLFVPFEDHSITTGKNKFDGRFDEDIIVGVAPSDVNVSSSGTSKSAVVPLERGKTYTIKKYAGGDRLRFSIVSKYPNKDVFPLPSLYHLVVDNSGEEYTLTLDNTYGQKPINYLVIYTNASAEETPLIQVEEGTIATEYESYELKYLGKPLSLSNGKNSNDRVNDFYILDDLNGVYESPDLPSVSPSQEFNLDASFYTDIYEIYDDLLTNNPGYISKSLRGNSTLDKPIYQYKFTPPFADRDVEFKRPKIILTSGTHGNEKSSVWGLAQFLKDMCENWKENHILEFFRWNFDFIVVPMINPSGYDLNQRKNANGVDLNRNFPLPTWQHHPSDPEDINYRGPNPASEIETQIMMEFLDENSDADFLIDYHNFFQHNNYLMWIASESKENKYLGLNVISALSRKWKKQYEFFPQDDGLMLGFVNATGTSSVRYYGHSIGIRSMTLETVHQVRYGINSELYDKTTITCAVDLVGNMLTAIAKSF